MGNENQEEKILYLCDGYGCDAKCELKKKECYKTFDINHAKNFFKRSDGRYIEKREDLRQTKAENNRYKRTALEGFVRDSDEWYWKITKRTIRENTKKITVLVKLNTVISIMVFSTSLIFMYKSR